MYCTDPKAGHPLAHADILEAWEDLTWPQLADWVRKCMKDWGYSLRDYSQVLLVSHFTTAELSHIKDFHLEATVRRVSAAQVYHASYPMSKRQRLVVMDTYHFFNVGNTEGASLFAVAEKFGERKIKLAPHLDISKVTREYLTDPEFREYAIWDAGLCARVFTKFRDRLLRDWQVDVVQYPTSASLAMAVYRQHWLPEDFEAPEPRVRRQAWRSLWGGRAEAYIQGDRHGDYTLRDVASLYPTSERLLKTLPRPRDWVQRDTPLSFKGLAHVEFSFPESVKYPCLPVCHDGRLIFPKEGIADCTLDEIRVALHLGAEVKYLEVWEYDHGDDSLTDFMEHFAKEKVHCEEEVESGGMRDAVGRELAKLMMNSLIGKLSQNKGDVDIEDLKKFSKKIGVPLPVVTSPNFLHPDKPSTRFRIGSNIMPEWSALILGKARSIMAMLLNGVGESLICSTDSMLVPSYLNPVVDSLMVGEGVILTNKNKVPTKMVRVVRNRVYTGIGEDGKISFGASHAIHLGYRKRGCPACEKGNCQEVKHSSLRLILSEETGYTKKERLGLKTAIRRGERFFSEKDKDMIFSRAWDQKRYLLPEGETRPWLHTQEYDEYHQREKT